MQCLNIFLVLLFIDGMVACKRDLVCSECLKLGCIFVLKSEKGSCFPKQSAKIGITISHPAQCRLVAVTSTKLPDVDSIKLNRFEAKAAQGLEATQKNSTKTATITTKEVDRTTNDSTRAVASNNGHPENERVNELEVSMSNGNPIIPHDEVVNILDVTQPETLNNSTSKNQKDEKLEMTRLEKAATAAAADMDTLTIDKVDDTVGNEGNGTKENEKRFDKIGEHDAAETVKSREGQERESSSVIAILHLIPKPTMGVTEAKYRWTYISCLHQLILQINLVDARKKNPLADSIINRRMERCMRMKK